MSKAAPKKLVAYYRVSTKRQGASGLGLAAQKRAVATYAASIKAQVVAEYREVETGKGRNPKRPQLVAAIERAKADGATLVVAKLDRLARNVAFLANLLESEVDFVACDNPHANRLTVHILAAVAEDEGRRISERTKAALAEAKRRGVVLGGSSHKNPRKAKPRPKRMSKAARNAKGSRANCAKAVAVARGIQPLVAEMRKKGWPLRRIAAELNKAGHRTRTGAKWTLANVSRVCPAARPSRSASAGRTIGTGIR